MMWMFATTDINNKSDSVEIGNDTGELQLVRACQRGDRDALERLFERYYPQVRRMILRTLGADDALDDLVQQTMMEIHRSLRRFRGDAQLSSWVYRISINVCNQYLRKKVREPGLQELPHTLKSGSSSPLAKLESAEAWGVLMDVVAGLPARRREILILAEIERLSTRQMGEVLGLSDAAVWSRLHQARKQFWSRLERIGYFEIDAPKRKGSAS